MKEVELSYSMENDEWVGEHLKFKDYEQYDKSILWTIVNKDEELLGYLEKIRVGAWMSWCLTLEDGCYLSAGCQDEVRLMTKRLNSKNSPTKTTKKSPRETGELNNPKSIKLNREKAKNE